MLIELDRINQTLKALEEATPGTGWIVFRALKILMHQRLATSSW